jgi:hypothetical protein
MGGMTSPEPPIDLPCHVCRYDLRAHPQDGKCPECGAPVAESRRWAAVPRRPAWRDSDPRWRRRVLAGVWLLALLPLMDVLRVSGSAASVPVPEVFDSRGTVRTLDDTLLAYPGVYQPLIFCIGVVLLFAKERGRRRAPLDWTRRWGVLCSYVALLLSAAQILYVGALVLAGIAYTFHALPQKFQPQVTQLFADVSTAYIRFGPQPKDVSGVVLVACSSIAILLACIPLFDALRSSGRKRPAAILLAPLVLFALIYLAQAGRYFVAFGFAPVADLLPYGVYFRPELLVRHVAGLPPGPGVSGPAGAFFAGVAGSPGWPATAGAFVVEAAKWCCVLAIATWLTIARLAAWRHGRKPSAA